MVKLFILCLEVEDLVGHVRQVALFCLGHLIVWDCHCLSHDGMLKAVGAIVAVTAFIASLVYDGQYFLGGKLSVLIDAHSGGVYIGNRAIFYLYLVFAIVQAAIPLLRLYQSLQRLYVRKFLKEQLSLCALFALLLLCPDLLKLLCCLKRQSLLLGPEQRLKKSLLIRNDPALVINLLLIIGQSFPPDPLLLFLYLFGNEIAHMQLRPLAHQFLHGEQQRMQIGKLIGQGRVQLFGLDNERLEVDIGCVEDITDVFCQLSCLSLEFYDVFHDLKRSTENYKQYRVLYLTYRYEQRLREDEGSR